MREVKTVNISTLTFIKIIIIFLLIAFLYLVKEVIVLIFLALIFASAINPWVHWLRKRKIPKTISILIIYIIFIGFIFTVIILVIPPLAKEIGQLAKLFPEYYEKIGNFFQSFQKGDGSSLARDVQLGLGNISTTLTQTISSLFTKTAQVFGSIFSFISVLVIAFYFAIEENAIKKFTHAIIPKKYQFYIIDLFSRIQVKLGQWFRGQLILSLIIFCITFLGLTIIGVKYALVLALLAGAFEIIPYFGPWVSGIIAVVLTFTQSPGKAILVIVLYIIVQQLENSIIVPKVIGKSVGLNPLIVIIAILVGFRIGGVIGALISVPAVAALSVFVSDFLNKRKI